MAGRRPQPTAIKRATNVRKSRIAKNEPRPPEGIPTPPDHLSDVAKTHWWQVSAVLKSMGLLSQAEAMVLERLCDCYAEVVELSAVIVAEGRIQTVVTENGKKYSGHPAVAQKADADRRYKGYLVELGLTPAARSKVNGSQEEDDDPASAYIA